MDATNHIAWARRAAQRLAWRYRCPTLQEDIENELIVRCLNGLSHRLSWLEVGRWIQRELSAAQSLADDASVRCSVVDVTQDALDISDFGPLMREIIQFLSPLDQQIVLMHLDGLRGVEIARRIGQNQRFVSRHLNDSLEILRWRLIGR